MKKLIFLLIFVAGCASMQTQKPTVMEQERAKFGEFWGAEKNNLARSFAVQLGMPIFVHELGFIITHDYLVCVMCADLYTLDKSGNKVKFVKVYLMYTHPKKVGWMFNSIIVKPAEE